MMDALLRLATARIKIKLITKLNNVQDVYLGNSQHRTCEKQNSRHWTRCTWEQLTKEAMIREAERLEDGS